MPITSIKPDDAPQMTDEEIRDLLAKVQGQAPATTDSADATEPPAGLSVEPNAHGIDLEGLKTHVEQTMGSPNAGPTNDQSTVHPNGDIDVKALTKDIADDSTQSATDSLKTPPISTSNGGQNGRSPADDTSDDTSDDLSSNTPKSTNSGPADFYQQLMQKYQGMVNKPQDDSALNAAIAARNSNQLAAGLGQAGQTIGAALSRTQPNTEFFKNQAAMAGQPVQDALLKQQAEQERTKNIESLLEKMGVAKDRAQAMAYAADARKDAAQQHNDLLKAMYGAKQQAAEATAGTKANDKQNQAITQTNQLLESARGNAAVQQAQKDIYSVNKAQALVNKYKDPNQISPQELNLFVSEISKIATGGAPTMGETQALTPNTLATTLAGVKSKLLNEPTAANAAAFVKRYESYLNDLKTQAQGVVQDKIGRVLETRKNMIGNDAYDLFKNQYGLDKGAAKSETQPAGGGMVQIKDTATGRIKAFSVDQAQKLLANPQYQQVQ